LEVVEGCCDCVVDVDDDDDDERNILDILRPLYTFLISARPQSELPILVRL
jgi:hypothetical protein